MRNCLSTSGALIASRRTVDLTCDGGGELELAGIARNTPRHCPDVVSAVAIPSVFPERLWSAAVHAGRFLTAFASVMADCGKVTGPIWQMGKNLMREAAAQG